MGYEALASGLWGQLDVVLRQELSHLEPGVAHEAPEEPEVEESASALVEAAVVLPVLGQLSAGWEERVSDWVEGEESVADETVSSLP